MRVVIVSGIYPPDIGGPATHADMVRAELARRGHGVSVLSFTDRPRAERAAGLVRFPRTWPWPLRQARVAGWLLRNRSRYDVVYATGLHAAAVLGARLSRRPVAIKIVGDPAWERARRKGLTEHDFEAFQDVRTGGPRLRAMRALRSWTVRHATRVTVPSRYLQEVVRGWAPGQPPPDVILNGVRVPNGRHADRGAQQPVRAVYVGRLVEHKHVDVLVDAVIRTEGVDLVVVGDGPARTRLARRAAGHERIRFTGALDHDQVIEELLASNVLVNASSYEGLPHVALEALACGVPVVASMAGGSLEAITPEVDGIVVRPPDAEGFAAALGRLRDDPQMHHSMMTAARRAGQQWRIERRVDEIEALLGELMAAPS